MNRFVPLIIVMVVVTLFAVMMGSNRNPKELKSVLIGSAVPSFEINAITEGGSSLKSADLKTGEPVIVNFFASWCVPCRAEHDNLMKLANVYNVPIIGIAFQDKKEDSLKFLAELGNPFTKIGADTSGLLGIDFGVTGVPETYLIDGDGIIRYRHWGPIVGTSLGDKLLPELEKLR